MTDWLLGLHDLPVYGLVGLLVFAEDALFVGFVLPGETAAVVGGVAASRGHASLPLMLAVVVGAAILGDTVGYEIGRHLGPRILRSHVLRKRSERIDAAREQLASRGGAAVFVGRFVSFFRATMPALAGTAGMRYPKFLAFNATGGLVWGVGVVLLGYLAGNSYATIEKTIGRASALIVLAALLTAVVIWRIRRLLNRRTHQNQAVDHDARTASTASAPKSVTSASPSSAGGWRHLHSRHHDFP
ncbi:DedA family protein [Kribbella turkmenica]|uniref:DedA family protein n=1 Tax=Kribbella turkmenica TaxID=2530375 RepID=UPI00192D6B7A|nr:DedA family protein [Kribbella turkmenica]